MSANTPCKQTGCIRTGKTFDQCSRVECPNRKPWGDHEQARYVDDRGMLQGSQGCYKTPKRGSS